MRVDGHAPTSSLSLHLDPKQARMMVNVELGVSMGDDAAIYLCVVLQHTIERLVAGALTSYGKPELRTKYGGTGRVVQPGADVHPRHLQDYIRTDKKLWSFFNSAFAFQVILSVFLDHATEKLFQRLGVPIHSKEALASCEYYATVIDGLQQQKKSYRLPSHSNNSGHPPSEQLLVTTSVQLARVVARVNPLCSLSPKACLMVEALTHEIFMALCEDVIQRRADTRVITIVDLEAGIRGMFPEGLAQEAALAGKEATLILSGGPAAPSAGGGAADDQVRLCVRRLQGTSTLVRKNFRVSPGSLLFTLFTKACERLRISESSVIFVHDGVILSGRQKAGTLHTTGRRAVQVFAVCKRAWACKQRAAARRGLLLESGESSRSGAQARKRYAHDAAQDPREKPWRQKHVSPQIAPRIRPAEKELHDAALHHPLLPVQPPPGSVLLSSPRGMGTKNGGGEVEGVPRPPRPRQTRRWIATPAEGTKKLDLGRLENARNPFPLRQRTRTFETGLSGSASTGTLVGSSGDRGAGGAGAVVSPRIERTVRRLSAMEACLRNLEDSMKELKSDGRQPGISSVAMAAITSQLDVALNLSSLCRQALSSADEGERQISQASRSADQSRQDRSVTHGQLHGEIAPAQQRDSFLTEVPAKSRLPPPRAGKVPVAAPVEVSSSREAAHDDGRAHEQNEAPARQASARQASRTKPSPQPLPAGAAGAQSRPAHSTTSGGRGVVARRHQPGGLPLQQKLSPGRNAGHEVLKEVDPHEGGKENGGVGDGWMVELEPASSLTSGQFEEQEDCSEEDNTPIVKEDVPSSRSSMASLGQNDYEGQHREEKEEAAVPREEIQPSWSSIVSEEHHGGRVGGHPSSIPEETSSWSGYISEFQPATPPEATLAGLVAQQGEIDVQPQRYGMERGGSEKGRPGLSGSEGSHGGGERRHGGLALDNDERGNMVLGTTILHADSGTGSGGTGGGRGGPVTLGGGSRGQAESPRGLLDAIPLESRPPTDALTPGPEPEAHDPHCDEHWDDIGDDNGDGAGDDGNWSSWLTGGGGVDAIPSTSNR